VQVQSPVQGFVVVDVTLIALPADAVVGGGVDLRVELQGEDVGRGERVALLAPSIAVRTAAIYGALLVRRRHVVNYRQHSKLTAEVEDG
jgi:hypothetical protein